MVATDLPGYYVIPPIRAQEPSPLRTDVAGFAGRALNGPISEPVLVQSVEDYELVFGPAISTQLGMAVRGYFDNGGELAWVVRCADQQSGETPYREVQSLLDLPQVALLVLPDLWDHLGTDSARGAPQAIGRIAAAAHATLDRMIVLDLPESTNTSAGEANRVLTLLDQALTGREARAVAVYHPWIRVEVRPGQQDGRLLYVPPGGHVAGLISRLDRERGPVRSPANASLAGAVDLKVGPLSAPESALVARRVNPIRCISGQGLQVWGARTFERAQSGRFLAHRRLLHRLVKACRQAGDALVFEPNDEQLRLGLAQTVRTVLLQAYRSGALAGRTDEEAFQVRCDDTTTLPADRDAGRVVCLIQLRPANPMEVIKVQLSIAAEGRLEVIEQ
jgi:phage tail sheath protein FI